MTPSEIDRQILALAELDWRKVAAIIGHFADDGTLDLAGDRIIALIEAGELEVQGNPRLWRYSEIRLPQGSP